MQIHELNNYSGSVNDGYVAVDNGTDTGKVAVPGLTKDVEDQIKQVNDRVDNIIAGGTAPSEAEVLDARLGAQTLGGVQYASLGAAIRGQAEELQEYLYQTDLETLTESGNGFIGINHAWNDSSYWRRSQAIDVTGADYVVFNKDYGVSTVSIYSFYTGNDYSYGTYISGANSITGGERVAVPSNAKTMIVCAEASLFSTISPLLISLIIPLDIASQMSTLAGNLIKTVTPDYSAHSYSRLSTDGSSAASPLANNMISKPIPVFGLNEIVYTTTCINPYNAGLSFTKSDTYPILLGDVVSSYVREGIGSYTIPVPEGARFVWLSSDMDMNGVITGTPTVKMGLNIDEYMSLSEYIGKSDNVIKIPMPSTINCFVGETLQLYYRGMFLCVDPYIYDIKIQCDVGDQFPRYYEITPISADVGEHNLYITIQSNNGVVLGTKTVKLKVHNTPSSPANPVNVLAVGASLTQNGEWVGEMKRVLSEDKGLSNINFVGRREVNGVKLEATGGYDWNSYTSTSAPNLYKFYFTAEHLPSVVNVGNTYTNNGKTFTVTEINIPTLDGGGYISCTGTGGPTASGTLTLSSGVGDPTLTFSASVVNGNPFLYNGAIDIQQYADDYCNGQIDVVYTELFVNGTTPYNSNVTAMMNQMRTFCQNIHSAFPSCKIVLGMPYCPDLRGGVGMNYHAAGGFSFGYGIKTTFMNYMIAVEKYLEDNSLDGYVSLVNWLNEFDSENDFLQTTKPVNIRSQVTEIFGVNGLHPALIGYYQMADSAVRHFVAEFC